MHVEEAVAIVTGSGRGIGRAVARELARRGARVVCASLESGELQETTDLILAGAGAAVAAVTDVTVPAQVERLIEQTLDAFGRIDILVNNAGVCRAVGGLWEADPALWWSDVATNLLGPFLCCRFALPHMLDRNSGIIVNMAGGGYDRPNPGLSAYASAKAGLMRMTDNLAAEIAGRYAIQVYGFWPGFVRTGMTEFLATDPEGQRWLPHVKAGLAGGEDHAAEDVGRAIAELIEISRPDLSGRIFSFDDDFQAIARAAAEIARLDLHQLRLRTLER